MSGRVGTCSNKMFPSLLFPLGPGSHKRTSACLVAATGSQSLFSLGPLQKKQKHMMMYGPLNNNNNKLDMISNRLCYIYESATR